MPLEICNGTFTRIINIQDIHEGSHRKDVVKMGPQNKKVWEALR